MLKQIIAILTTQIELLRLAVANYRRTPPQPPRLVELTPETAEWEIIIPGGEQPRFMSVRQIPNADVRPDHFVVMVDADAFYRTWLQCSQPGKPERLRRPRECVTRAKMPADRKYAQAMDGFSRGFDNPVPLANCSVYHEGNGVVIDIGDGATRTLWLLANRASSFPIEVHGRRAAELLHKVAGIGSAPLSFAELFHHASPA